MLTLKGWVLSTALILLYAAQPQATGPLPFVCRAVNLAAGAAHGLTHSEFLIELGLATPDGRRHPEADLAEYPTHSLQILRRNMGHFSVEVATLPDAHGKPAFLRTRLRYPKPHIVGSFRDLSPVYHRVNADESLTELPTPVKILQASFDSLRSPPSPSATLDSADPLPGAETHAGELRYLTVLGDVKTHHTPHDRITLIVRTGEPQVKGLEVDRFYTYGMGPCAGVFIEGKNFAVVSHLVSAGAAPPEQVFKMILERIAEEGLSTDGMKVRVIGGDDAHPDLARALVNEAKKRKLNLVETDILGTPGPNFAGRSHGYQFTDDPFPVPMKVK